MMKNPRILLVTPGSKPAIDLLALPASSTASHQSPGCKHAATS